MREFPSSLSEPAKVLEEIKADNRSGAAQLAQRGGQLLLDVLKQGRRKEVLALGRALRNAQPSMAPLVNLVNHLFHAIESIQDPHTLGEQGAAAVQGFLDSLMTGAEEIRGHALALLKGKKVVLTLSYSSTIMRVLEHARGLEVICPESRPLLEGLRTAKELGAKGIRVRVVADFAALSLVGECDLVMLGADAITPKGVVNKIGTYGLALAARAKGVPFYVLAGTEKFLSPPFSDVLRIEEKNPQEITHETIPQGIVENLYFDLTPLNLIAGVVTQDGIMSGNEVREVLEGMTISEGLKKAP
jgi:translation initiation factor eIF-2B subunit delta